MHRSFTLAFVMMGLIMSSAPGCCKDSTNTAKPFTLRSGFGWGLDFGVGLGKLSYVDSLEDYHRGGDHAYVVSGMQLMMHEVLGPVGLHQCIDFSWETFKGEFDIPLDYISQFSRSLTLLGGIGSRVGNFLDVEPLVGYGWVYHKTAGYDDGEQKDESVFLTTTYSGVVAGSQAWLALGGHVGLRILYTHGFYEKSDDRLTLQWGWLDLDQEFDEGYEGPAFGGIGVRYARLPHGIDEVYFLLGFGCVATGSR